MLNNPSSNTDEKKCEYCGSDKTYLAVTKNGTPYPKWNSNPLKENTLICSKCYRNLLYHKILPPSHARKSIRRERVEKRVCFKCGGKATTQASKTSSSIYHIWHRHPKMIGKWLCGKCYASWLFQPKRKFKTKEECYKYMSKRMSGPGNPMYRNHTLNLGRVYTPERNRRVSEAVKKYAKSHPEHYYKMGVLGALKARKMGLSGIPTSLELKMEIALRKHKIQYLSQRRYGIGIMDFYLPDGNIALFVDGAAWHADPRLYGPDDTLFFGSKISKQKWKNVTAKDKWRKDRFHNMFLKSKGYTVVRFWEKEIKCEIEKCIQIIWSHIQTYKDKHISA